MQVKEIMTKNVIAAYPWSTVKEAAKIMLDNNIGGLPIIDEEQNIVGILTESDFIGRKVNVPHAMVSLTKLLGQTHYKADIESIFNKAKNFKVENVMNKKIFSLPPTASLSDANESMVRNKVSRLPIINNGKLVGIITKRDILRNFSGALLSATERANTNLSPAFNYGA
ncbi:CBS domain-containing protein [Halobacteriovorax sp. HLS]|uniref:CBS domain-containing protein n=1 Tax=Halobacteriovorax sp. HLS TaxID=2234000 RepID=UPI000FDB174F|nr:CBS domain-containing protein [Halobacteriovorax sp. HLS]